MCCTRLLYATLPNIDWPLLRKDESRQHCHANEGLQSGLLSLLQPYTCSNSFAGIVFRTVAVYVMAVVAVGMVVLQS